MIIKRFVTVLGGAVLLSSLASINRVGTRAAPIDIDSVDLDLGDLNPDCDPLNTSELGEKAKFLCLGYQPAIAGRSPAPPAGRPVGGGGGGRPTTDPSRPKTGPVTDPNLQTGPGGAPVLGDPSLVNPGRPAGEPAGEAGGNGQGARPDPNPNEPVADVNAPGRSDVTIDPSVYTVTDMSDGGFVRPKQIKDTIQAVADQKKISPEDPGWWGWSGFDMTAKIESDPNFVTNVQKAIKDHMNIQDINPSFLRDLLPAEARDSWLSFSAEKLDQKQVWNRMSYSFANWINGERFYVVVEAGKDPMKPYTDGNGKTSAGNFALYETAYITGGEKKFQSVWKIEIQPDGGLKVSEEMMWQQGNEPLGSQPFDAWVTEDQFNLDLSGGPGDK